LSSGALVGLETTVCLLRIIWCLLRVIWCISIFFNCLMNRHVILGRKRKRRCWWQQM
jgi:hypothetical protein